MDSTNAKRGRLARIVGRFDPMSNSKTKDSLAVDALIVLLFSIGWLWMMIDLIMDLMQTASR